MGKKNKTTKTTKDQNPPIESVQDQVDGSSKINSLIQNRLLVSVFLFLISFLVYVPSLGNDFVWDDISYIKNKASSLEFSQLDPEFFSSIVQKSSSRSKYFRPVFKVSLILDNEIWDTNPFGFHLSSIILHSIATVLLYFLVLLLLKEFKVGGRHSIALISSILFALYPLHAESVSFISARGDLLAAVFMLLSLITYILSYRKLYYLFPAGVFFILAFLSKEVAIVLPVLMFCFDAVSRRLSSRINLIKYAIIGLIVIFYFYIRSKSFLTVTQIVAQSTEVSQSFMNVVEILLNTYLFYIAGLIFPYFIHPFIDVSLQGDLIKSIISVFVLIALCVAVYFSIKKNDNITAYSILWILVALLPATAVAIFPYALSKLADRFLYVPSAGICILFAYVIYVLGRRFKVPWITFGLTVLLAVSFAIVTVKAQRIWKNNLNLWETAVMQFPDSLAAKLNYGDALRNSGKPAQALRYYLEIYKNDSILNKSGKLMVLHGISVSYIDLGDYRNAEKWLNITLEKHEEYESFYYYHMGFISLRKNDPESAEAYLLKSIEGHTTENSYYLLGGIYFIKAERENSFNNYKKAEKYLNEALEMNSIFPEANLLMAKTYLALGQKGQAKQHAQIALSNTRSENVATEAQSILNMN